MKKLAVVAALLMVPQAFAAGDDEYVEVTAPNECCAGLPSGLGLLTGWVGASGASGAATLKEAALKAAVARAAKQKSKTDKKNQKSDYDDATKGENSSSLDTLYHELGLTLQDLIGTGGSYRLKYSNTNPDGSEEKLEIEECIPSGALNPKNPPCTMKKFELFTDPTDGVERWAFTLAVIEAKYNPKHYYAEKNGYYASTIDKQEFTLVFDTEADLIWQLKRMVGRI